MLATLILLFSCRNKPKTFQGYSKKNNCYYKLISLGDAAQKTDSSQYIIIQATCFTLSDSVFWNSKHAVDNPDFLITNNAPSLLKNIYGFSEGDSLQYLFPTAAFFSEFFQSPVPYFCEKDSCIKFSLKIIRHLNRQEFKTYHDSLEKKKSRQEASENLLIAQYLSKNCKQVQEFAPNAFLEKESSATGESVKKGNKIKVLYKGYFLDGTLVDYTPNKWAFEFTYGQEGQMLRGLELALSKLKKGEKAKIILPSQLAFGSEGSSNGAVPPYTPLVYKIEIVDIK